MSDQRSLYDAAAELEPELRPCPFCHGRRVAGDRDPWDAELEPCPRCAGAGVVDMNPATTPIPF